MNQCPLGVHYSTGSREYRERERARVEEGGACTGESRNPERGRKSSAESGRERERERETRSSR